MAKAWKRKVVQAFLAGSLVVSSGTIALANEGGTGLKVISTKAAFTDIEGHWAQDVIEKMAEQKIINGYPDFTFQPNQPVTKLQAVTIIINLLKQKNADLVTSRNDYVGEVPAWAKESIELAIYNDIVRWEDMSNYSGAATRMFVVELLINALGVEPAASTSGLAFTDIADLSNEEKAILSTSIQHKLVEGYSDNKFRPYKTVTRAEMATFADRLFEKIGDAPPVKEEPKVDYEDGFDRLEIAIGTISRIAADVKKLTIGTTTFDVADNVVVKINDKQAAYEDLKIRMSVRVVLRDDTITEIEAYTDEEETPAVKETISGTVSYLNFVRKEIMVDKKTFTVDSKATIEINGEKGEFAHLEEDMEAVLVTVDGKVQSIYAFDFAQKSDVEFKVTKEKATTKDNITEARWVGSRVSDETPDLEGERLRISLNEGSFKTIDLDNIDGSQRDGEEVAEELEEAIEDALKSSRIKVSFSSADRFIIETKNSPTNKVPSFQFDGDKDVLNELGLHDKIVKGSLEEYNTWKISVKSDARQNQTYSIYVEVEDEDVDEIILFTVRRGDTAEEIAESIADALIFTSEVRSLFKITVDDEDVLLTPRDEESLDVTIKIEKR